MGQAGKYFLFPNHQHAHFLTLTNHINIISNKSCLIKINPVVPEIIASEWSITSSDIIITSTSHKMWCQISYMTVLILYY